MSLRGFDPGDVERGMNSNEAEDFTIEDFLEADHKYLLFVQSFHVTSHIQMRQLTQRYQWKTMDLLSYALHSADRSADKS